MYNKKFKKHNSLNRFKRLIRTGLLTYVLFFLSYSAISTKLDFVTPMEIQMHDTYFVISPLDYLFAILLIMCHHFILLLILKGIALINKTCKWVSVILSIGLSSFLLLYGFAAIRLLFVEELTKYLKGLDYISMLLLFFGITTFVQTILIVRDRN